MASITTIPIATTIPISITMKKRNIKLLDSNELNDFYKKIILPISMDFNFTNRHEMREDYFEKSLPLLIRGLWKCEYLESYRKRGEIGRVNLRLSFNPNESREEIVSQVRAVIESEHLYSHKTF